MHLLDWFDDEIEYKGTKYPLNLDFFNVLTVLAVLEDNELTEHQRVYTALELLLDLDVIEIDDNSAIELLEIILGEHITQAKEEEPELDIEGNPMKIHKPKASYDFLYDGAYIEASFRQAYNIDLFAVRGQLHWRRFLALFEGLPKDTIMMQVIKIRQMPVPTGDAEQAQAVAKLKHIYKLPNRGGGE